VLTLLVCAAGLGIVLTTDLAPRFQRADWTGVAHALRASPPASAGSAAPAASVAPVADRAIVTVELGAAPLEYYLPGLQYVHPGTSVRVREVDLVGYAPLRSAAASPLTPAFRPAGRLLIHRLDVYRFVAATPQLLTETELRADRLTPTSSEVLAPTAALAGG